MRATWLVSMLALAGCLDTPPESVSGDGDGGTPYPGCSEWKPRHVDPCGLPAPVDIDLGGGLWSYDTTTGQLTAPGGEVTMPPSAILPQLGGAQLRALSAIDFSIDQNAGLRVRGDYPLLIAAFSTIAVAGELDAASRAGARGAGGDDASCRPAAAGTGNQDAGGGGGGGLGGQGGDGGDGGGGGDPGAGGDAIEPPLAVVMGGCPGAAGGGGSGKGGSGGGGIQLSAADEIAIAGVVQAGGAGGRSATGDNGGGGGGSGGYLGLDAPLVILGEGAVLAANGGGGGTGCDGQTGTNGGDGAPDGERAPGGSGGCTAAADGGPGGALGAVDGGAGANDAQSGGGGGGSAGFVIIDADELDDLSLVVSPAPITP